MIAGNASKTGDGALEAAAEENTCPISSRLLREPVRTPCGHVFSRKSLLTWLLTKEECPMCRSPLAAHQLQDDHAALARVEAALAERPELEQEEAEEAEEQPVFGHAICAVPAQPTLRQLRGAVAQWHAYARGLGARAAQSEARIGILLLYDRALARLAIGPSPAAAFLADEEEGPALPPGLVEQYTPYTGLPPPAPHAGAALPHCSRPPAPGGPPRLCASCRLPCPSRHGARLLLRRRRASGPMDRTGRRSNLRGTHSPRRPCEPLRTSPQEDAAGSAWGVGPCPPELIELSPADPEWRALLSHPEYLDAAYYGAHVYRVPPLAVGAAPTRLLLAAERAVVSFLNPGTPVEVAFLRPALARPADPWSPLDAFFDLRVGGRSLGAVCPGPGFTLLLPPLSPADGPALLLSREAGGPVGPLCRLLPLGPRSLCPVPWIL
eukprot:tig00000076_g2349.t1